MTFMIGIGIFLVLPIIIILVIMCMVNVVEQLKDQQTGNGTSGSESVVCSIDTDCPTGYVCRNGKCVPQLSGYTFQHR